jgi:hypothetical protein
MTTKKLTKDQLRSIIMENLNDEGVPAWDAAFEKWFPYFKKVGFGDHAIDLGDIDPELIEMLGETIKRYLANKRIRTSMR